MVEAEPETTAPLAWGEEKSPGREIPIDLSRDEAGAATFLFVITDFHNEAIMNIPAVEGVV